MQLPRRRSSQRQELRNCSVNARRGCPPDAAIGRPTEAHPSYIIRTFAEIALWFHTTKAALILLNGLQYARGRDQATAVRFRHMRRPESPPPPPAAPAVDRPPRPRFPMSAD